MIWWWENDDKLGDWGIVDRHRKRAYAEGIRDGIVVGCVIAVAGGFAVSWLLGKYWS